MTHAIGDTADYVAAAAVIAERCREAAERLAGVVLIGLGLFLAGRRLLA